MLLQTVIAGDEMAIVNGGPQTYTEGLPAIVLAVAVLSAWVYCVLSALVTRSGTFAIAPHLGPARPGIHIGQIPRLIRYTLTRCVTAACTGRETISLNTGPAAHRVWLADNGNGRLLIVEDAARETTTVTM